MIMNILQGLKDAILSMEKLQTEAVNTEQNLQTTYGGRPAHPCDSDEYKRLLMDYDKLLSEQDGLASECKNLKTLRELQQQLDESQLDGLRQRLEESEKRYNDLKTKAEQGLPSPYNTKEYLHLSAVCQAACAERDELEKEFESYKRETEDLNEFVHDIGAQLDCRRELQDMLEKKKK